MIDSSKNQILLKQQICLKIKQPYIEKTAIDISNANTNLAVATKEYQRQKLLKGYSTSKKQFEQAQSKYIQANNQLETLEVIQIINKFTCAR